MLRKGLLIFTVVWLAALVWIWLSTEEMAQAFLLLYTALAGAVVYWFSLLGWLVKRGLGQRERSGLNGWLLAAVLMLIPPGYFVWYICTH